MSRNRGYDDDDMYDYDDDYDEYDAYFKKKPAAKLQQAPKKAAPTARATAHAAKAAPSSSTSKPKALEVVGPKASPAQPAQQSVQVDPLKAIPKKVTDEEFGQMDMMELMGFDSVADGNITSVFTGAEINRMIDDLSDDDLESFAAIADQYSSSSTVSRKSGLVMIVSGHVDAGKSTLVGNLLHRAGEVSQKVLRKYEKESKNIGKVRMMLLYIYVC